MKESSLIKVFDNDKLVGLYDGQTSATQRPLDLFEQEILRIFNENKKLRERIAELEKYEHLETENKRLKERIETLENAIRAVEECNDNEIEEYATNTPDAAMTLSNLFDLVDEKGGEQ